MSRSDTDGTRGYSSGFDFDTNMIRLFVGGALGSLAAGLEVYSYSGSGGLALMSGSIAWFPSMFITRKLFDEGPSGSMGSLVVVEENSTKVYNIDATDPRLRDLTHCEEQMSAANQRN